MFLCSRAFPRGVFDWRFVCAWHSAEARGLDAVSLSQALTSPRLQVLKPGPPGSFDAAGCVRRSIQNLTHAFLLDSLLVAAFSSRPACKRQRLRDFSEGRFPFPTRPQPYRASRSGMPPPPARVSAPHVQRVGQKEYVMFYEAIDEKGAPSALRRAPRPPAL